ncbi:MAG TPA: type II toxin-antitoxin system PemK/MazF family toxin [Candidatus Paceibacterota bacterium]
MELLQEGARCDPPRIEFHDREVWWASFGINVGVEINGKNSAFERPCLILTKFNKEMAWAIPAVSKDRDSMFYLRIEIDGKPFILALSQLRTISSKRLLRKEGMVPISTYIEIKRRIMEFLITKKDPP